MNDRLLFNLVRLTSILTDIKPVSQVCLCNEAISIMVRPSKVTLMAVQGAHTFVSADQ